MASERPGPEQLGIDESRDIEDLHHLQLMTLLREQVRDHGVRKAARKLDVDHRTLSAGLQSGQLSRRLRLSLEKALLAGSGSPAQEQRQRNDELAGRLEVLEKGMEALGSEMRDGLGAVQGEVDALRNEQAEGMERLARLEAGEVVDGSVAKGVGGDAEVGEGESGNGRQPQGKPAPRREYPDLATLEPANDDEEVFGAAWPLVREWRKLKETHPDRGGGLDWLLVEERFMSVELELLEEHGLTLPPETYPLRGLDRGAQVNWRRKALHDTRRAIRKRELLRRLKWVLGLGLWRKWRAGGGRGDL